MQAYVRYAMPAIYFVDADGNLLGYVSGVIRAEAFTICGEYAIILLLEKEWRFFMERAALKAAAKRQIKGNLGVLFLITLLANLILGALAVIPLVGSIAYMLLSAAFVLAITDIYLGMSYGRKPEVSDLFGQLKNVLPAFCTSFLVGLYTFLWSLLLFVPGIIKACSYSQTMYILAEDPTLAPKEAIERSKEMMQGHKMEYFKLLLSFLGWFYLGAFTFGLLYIWLIPYINATMVNFYRGLKGEFIE